MKLFSGGKIQKENSRVRLPLQVYLSYLLIASFVLTGVSLSKYASSASAQSDARAAVFSVSVEGDTVEPLVLQASDEAQSSDSYSFKVTSNSEVLVADVVTVTLPDVLPESVSMSMTVNSETCTPECSGNKYTYVKNFGFGEESHVWTLTFSIDSCSANLTEKYALDNIDIHVDAMQID